MQRILVNQEKFCNQVWSRSVVAFHISPLHLLFRTHSAELFHDEKESISAYFCYFGVMLKLILVENPVYIRTIHCWITIFMDASPLFRVDVSKSVYDFGFYILVAQREK